MQHVLVFSTSAPQNTLTDEMIGDLLDRVGLPAASSPPDWLAPGQAAEIPLADGAAPEITALRRAGEAVRIDINVVALENRRKKLLLADMDSTIITDESLDEMAALAGLGEAVAAITARSMNGELDFEAALDERVAMFAGQPASLFESILAATQLTAGARTLVQTMRTHHAHCYLVSGGFTPVADRVAKWCGFHAAHANDMTISDGVITGTVKKPVLGRESKAQLLAHYCAEHALAASDAAAIGDGANDMAVLQAAGMGVAFAGKDVLRAAINLQLNHTDLTGLLFLQGYRKADFITGEAG